MSGSKKAPSGGGPGGGPGPGGSGAKKPAAPRPKRVPKEQGIPPQVEGLKTFLAGRGFRLVEEQHEPELFGDRRFRWAHDDMRLQMSLDRGHWFVDVIPAWWSEWFGYGLEIVVDTLDEIEDHFTALLTLQDAVDILTFRLDEIMELVSTAEGCAAVEAERRDRAHRWFGA